MFLAIAAAVAASFLRRMPADRFRPSGSAGLPFFALPFVVLCDRAPATDGVHNYSMALAPRPLTKGGAQGQPRTSRPPGAAGGSGAEGRSGAARDGRRSRTARPLPRRTSVGEDHQGRVLPQEPDNQHVQLRLQSAERPPRPRTLLRERPSAECPGTAADPQAASGHLCLYQSNNSVASACVFATDDPMSSCTSATRFGFGASTSGEMSGQWAVTAP
jgi:hypothetical protein